MKPLNSLLREEKLLLFASNWVLYGTTLFIYTFVPYYHSLLDHSIPFIHIAPQELLFWMLCCFTSYILLTKIPIGSLAKNRAYLTLHAIAKIVRALLAGNLTPTLTPEEKVSALLFLVKFFFVPLMLSFLLQNCSGVIASVSTISASAHSLSSDFVFSVLYPFALSGILFIDTAYFCAGYLTESQILGNQVRSVDTTVLGWLSALACYPPFNSITNTLLGWHSVDFNNFGNITLNLFFGGLALLCMCIYVWATLSLGWKASNLTNRGIVSHWAYAIVRHPAYISKNLAWWIMGLPVILATFSENLASHHSLFDATIASFVPIISLMAWSCIYYLRAITEERHLSLDPAYQKYMKKVPYRFLPGVY